MSNFTPPAMAVLVLAVSVSIGPNLKLGFTDRLVLAVKVSLSNNVKLAVVTKNNEVTSNVFVKPSLKLGVTDILDVVAKSVCGHIFVLTLCSLTLDVVASVRGSRKNSWFATTDIVLVVAIVGMV